MTRETTPATKRPGQQRAIVTRVAVIDDDKDVRVVLMENICDHGGRTRGFESAFDALDWSADVALIDVSAVSGNGMGSWGQGAYSPIAMYAERHPGCRIIITSGLPVECFAHIVDEVRAVLPDSLVESMTIKDVLMWIQSLSE